MHIVPSFLDFFRELPDDAEKQIERNRFDEWLYRTQIQFARRRDIYIMVKMTPILSIVLFLCLSSCAKPTCLDRCTGTFNRCVNFAKKSDCSNYASEFLKRQCEDRYKTTIAFCDSNLTGCKSSCAVEGAAEK